MFASLRMSHLRVSNCVPKLQLLQESDMRLGLHNARLWRVQYLPDLIKIDSACSQEKTRSHILPNQQYQM